ncbi:MAG: hypothetical protein RML73_07895 [Anaerolineae bacterium]|nr:hypothetical protein [Anaerolineae bacterium]
MTTETRVKLDTSKQRPPNVFRSPSYREEDFLGRGMLGSVYKGVDGSYAIVVKVPNDADKHAEVQREYDVLAAIHDKLGSMSSPVPEVAFGRVGDVPALVMPFYRDDDLLAKKVRRALAKDELVEAERWAVQAAIAFCRAMSALKAVGYSCTDRKVSDFYYLDDGRHVVIDWNVVRESTLEFHIGEMRLFGYLWHELFLQRKGQAPFQPFYDNRWRPFGQDKPAEGCLSVGLRLILNAAITFPDQPADHLLATRGQPDFDLLRKHLEDWLSALEGKPLPPGWLSLNDAERQAVQVDLDYRLGRAVSTEARQAALEAAGGLDWATHIAQTLETDPSKLEKVLQKAKDYILPEHAERWQLLLKIAQEVADFRTRQYLLSRLVKVGQTLHSDPQDDDPQRLKTLEEELKAIVDLALGHDDALEALRAECVLRQHAWMRRTDLDQQISEYAKLDVKRISYIDTAGQFIRQIVAPYFNYLDDLLESDVPAAIFRAYQLALALSRSDIERDWLKQQTALHLETARCLQAYSTIEPTKARAGLKQVRCLRDKWQARNADHLLTSRLKDLVSSYEQHIREAVHKFLEDKPYTLKGFTELMELYGSDLLRPYGFDKVENFYTIWHTTYAAWAEQPQDRQLAGELVRLVERGHKEGWNMSDLLGEDREKILKSLRMLASEVQEQASSIEARLREFANSLSIVTPQLSRELEGLGQKVKETTQSIDQIDRDLQARLSGAQRTLDTHERLAQLLRALEDYNIKEAKRLMEELSHSDASQAESVRPYYDAVSELCSDEGVLSFYKDVKAQLEAGGTLSRKQYDWLIQKFAHNSLVQELLSHHRLNQLQVLMKLKPSNFHQRLHEYERDVHKIRTKLADLRLRFVNLEQGAIQAEIEELDRLLPNDDEIISEVVRSWRRRLVALREGFAWLESIRYKLPSSNKSGDLEAIATRLRRLAELLRSYDVEVFTPALHRAWLGALNAIQDALDQLTTEKNKLSQESKKQAESFKEKILSMEREAERRAESCKRLYDSPSRNPQGGGQ